jgi:hypothetical protein
VVTFWIALMFVPEKDEVTGCQRKLCNEEIHNLYSSQNIIIIVKWKDEMSTVYNIQGEDEKYV